MVEYMEIETKMDKLNDKSDEAFLEKNEKIIKMAAKDAIRFSKKQLDNVKVDYDALEKLAIKEKPKLIVGGASAYPLVIDFKGANFNYINGQYYHEYNDYPYATDIQGNQIERNFNGTRTVPAINQVVAYAKKQGYDGVIAKSIQDFRRLRDNESDLPYKNDEYIVFNPNQIMIVGRE